MNNEVNPGNSEPEQNSVDNMTPSDFINGRYQQNADENVVGQEAEAHSETESTQSAEVDSQPTDVLSNMDLDSMSETELKEISQKLGTKAVARYGELTARRKQAEEKMQRMEQELAQLKKAKQEAIPEVKNNPLADITDPKKLIEQRDSAMQVVEWAEDLLDESEDYRSDDVITQVEGKEYTKAEVKKTLKKSRDMLNKFIPAQTADIQRRGAVQQQTQLYQRKALSEFNWMKDAKNKATQQYKAMLGDKRLANLKETNPELSAQMPYILAHAANSMHNRTPIGTQTKKGITPPRTVSSNAARPERKSSTQSVKHQEVGQRYKQSGKADDFIALRTIQLSQ
tara:strand:- start:3526 stop:4548 length:1023 start_codon:yes stop_codon:yes gene_type:complete